MPQKLSIQQFAAQIKAKYPDYSSVPDDELVRRITFKYPDYLSMVQFDAPPAPYEANDPRLVREYSPTQLLGYNAQRFRDAIIPPRPKTATPTLEEIAQTLPGEGDVVEGMVKGTVMGPVHLAQGLAREDSGLAAQGAAETISGTLPAIAGARTGVRAVTTPDNLMLRAANNRAAIASSRAPTGLPTSVRGAVVQGASRAMNPARRLAAAVEERVARWIAPSPRGKTVALAIEEPAPVSILPERTPDPFTGNYRRSSGPSQPLEVPEGFGSSMTERATGPTAAEIAATERAIKPLGRKAQQSTIRNIPQLAKVAPELFPVDYATFPAKAMQTLERTSKTIEAAEAAVPRATMVPRKPILEGFAALAEEYKARGIPTAEAAIENVAKRWLELPEQIPWEQFVKMKRGFFDNTATAANSTPLMRAYGHLMDASSKVSTALAEANRAYSIVRRAMQDAGVDVRSGRRIREVGK